jgi:HD-GYP domain-containing protein (c-di-GMP phosphodiesterase class II)
VKIQADLWKIVYAVSDALDLVGVDDFYHGKRTAFMTVTIGRQHGLDDATLDVAFDAALLHDCGVSSTRVHKHLVNELDWAGSQTHCLLGHDLLSSFPPFAHLAEVVRHHHTHWDALQALNLPPQTAELANLIYLADRVDALAGAYTRAGATVDGHKIGETVAALKGTFFAPQWVDGFLKVADAEAFWFAQEPRHIQQFLGDMTAYSRRLELPFDQLKQLATLLSRIVDAKSPFTVQHSLGVSRLARLLATLFGLPEDSCDKIELAGLMHDIGKLAVTDHILEKPAALSEAEYAQMKRHSFETYQILRRIPGFEDIASWAAYHHENLAGTGYPYHHGHEELGPEARIIAAADVFQALAQKRPYRSAMEPGQVLEQMQAMADDGRLDREVLETIIEHLPACWEAATGQAT